MNINNHVMAPESVTIGIVSIGEMGMGIAKLLKAHKYRVVTSVSDRRSAMSAESVSEY